MAAYAQAAMEKYNALSRQISAQASSMATCSGYLDEETNKNILAYLVKNSAENSTTKASFKFLNSIKNEDIIAMSQTSFWKKVHNEIPKEVFNNPKIKSKANCKACHTDIEKGFIQSENIKDFDDIK